MDAFVTRGPQAKTVTPNLYHISGSLEQADCRRWMREAMALEAWAQKPMRMGGEVRVQRRPTCAFATSPNAVYGYSGFDAPPSPPMPPWVIEARDAATAAVRAQLKYRLPPFNHCLLNLYEDGRQCIGLHSDQTHGLVNDVVMTVSLGAARFFDVHGQFNREKHRLILAPGDVVLMTKGCQKQYKHGVPTQATVTEPRVSLTFRGVRLR